MDLQTIKSKLSSYDSVADALMDLQLIWDNCQSFNAEKSEIYSSAIQLSLYQKSLVKVCDLAFEVFYDGILIVRCFRTLSVILLESNIRKQKRPVLCIMLFLLVKVPLLPSESVMWKKVTPALLLLRIRSKVV